MKEHCDGPPTCVRCRKLVNGAPLLPRQWMACKGYVASEQGKRSTCFGYVGVANLTPLTIGSAPDLPQIRPSFREPSDLLKEHSARDLGSGNLQSVEWHEGRWLDVSPGRTIDQQVVAIKRAELCRKYKVFDLAYECWSIHDPLRKIDCTGLAAQEGEGDGLRFIPWGSGYSDMAPAIEEVEVAVNGPNRRIPGPCAC